MVNNAQFKFLKVFGRTMHLFWKTLDQWRLFLIYAGLMTIISLVFGRWSYSCLDGLEKIWCYNVPENLTHYVIYLVFYYLLLLCVSFSFGSDIYDATFKNAVFKVKDIVKITRHKIKNVIFSLTCVILMIFGIFLVYKILNKPANPNWKIEFIYFLMVFISAALFIMSVRLSSFVGYYMDNGKMPSLRILMKKTSEKAYIPISLFMIILLIVCIIQIRVIADLTNFNADNKFSTVILSEYLDFIFKLLFYTIFLAFFRAQFELLNDEQEQLSIQENPDNSSSNSSNITEKPIKEKKKTKLKVSKKKAQASTKKTTKKVSRKKK